ncbi:MAG TPA: hypothetical protein VJS43_11045 [Candidatus Acidoferrales bacterium]|nr:hypothetical protein [Candidatus Acidoferrales bacterium]
MKTGHFALAMLLVLGMGAITMAQDNSQSAAQSSSTDPLAAAARRARQERKDQPKAAKVYTNDNLPTNATISFVGSEPSASAPAAKDANAPAADATKATVPAAAESAQASGQGLGDAAKMTPEQKKAADQAALATAKQQLESAKTDLDLQQRKFALDQQSYMGNPNHDSDKSGAAALQTEQDNITAKQDEVDAAQRVVNDLETRLGVSTTASDSSSSGDSANSHPF